MQTKNLGIPMIYTKEGQTTLSFDIYSQLLNNRIIMLDDEINNHSASVVVAQLLYLNSLSDEQIDLYINSSESKLYVATNDAGATLQGSIYCYDLNNRKLLWEKKNITGKIKGITYRE